MAARRPMVYVSGRLKELPSGDTLIGVGKRIDLWRPRDNQPPAANFATLDTRNSIALLAFDGGSADEIARGVCRLPYGLDYSAGIKASGLCVAATATSGNMRWGFRIWKLNSGAAIDSDSFSTEVVETVAANGTNGVTSDIVITNTNLDGAAAGDWILWEVYRDASDTTNDTMSGFSQLLGMELEAAA